MDSDRSVPIKKSKFDLFFFFGISYLLIMAFLIAAPTKTISENIEVSYLDKETYYVQEAYDVQESYNVQEAYTGQESYMSTESYLDTVYQSQVQNAGTGKYFNSCGSGTCSNYDYNPNLIPSYACNQCTYTSSELVTKYRSVTKYRPVTQYRTVTNYRTVTKYKDVPKVRDVTKTRIEPRPAEVNWVIGFKAPYTLHLPFT